MATPTTIALPHQLGSTAARARLETGLEKLRAQYGNYVSIAEGHWSGDELTVGVTALGQSASGTVAVSDTEVRVSYELPFLLRMFAGQIETYLKTEATQFFRVSR